MKSLPENNPRVLAIDPYALGIGFALMEGPEQLVDFGLKTIQAGGDKNARSLANIEELVERFDPNVVVVEEYQPQDYRRRVRACALVQEVLTLAAEKNLQARAVSRQLVRTVFESDVAVNKYHIAKELAKCFPELELFLYPPRKLWIREPWGANVFDAVTLALIFFSCQPGNTEDRSANQQTGL